MALRASAARTTGSIARYSSHGASDMPDFGDDRIARMAHVEPVPRFRRRHARVHRPVAEPVGCGWETTAPAPTPCWWPRRWRPDAAAGSRRRCRGSAARRSETASRRSAAGSACHCHRVGCAGPDPPAQAIQDPLSGHPAAFVRRSFSLNSALSGDNDVSSLIASSLSPVSFSATAK